MYDRTQTTSLFTTAQSGLQSSLQYLLNNNNGTISRTDITNILSNNTSGVNSSFYQMISSQFSTLDKNNDGTLTTEEANEMISGLSNGLTRDQLLQLRSQGAIDEELANKILSNFAKVDQNGDGKVSEAEINSYCIGLDKEEMQEDKTNLLLKNMSTYYDVDVDTASTKSKES